MTKSIIIIDDDDEFRDSASRILLDHDYDVWDACCPDDAFSVLRQERFDIILCDLHMPFTMGKDKDDYLTSFEVGIKTVHELAWVYPNTPVIAVSTAPTEELARIQPLLSPIQAFSKPTHAEDLMAIVTRAKIPVTTESH